MIHDQNHGVRNVNFSISLSGKFILLCPRVPSAQLMVFVRTGRRPRPTSDVMDLHPFLLILRGSNRSQELEKDPTTSHSKDLLREGSSPKDIESTEPPGPSVETSGETREGRGTGVVVLLLSPTTGSGVPSTLRSDPPSSVQSSVT